jgi:hypothetical protein
LILPLAAIGTRILLRAVMARPRAAFNWYLA